MGPQGEDLLKQLVVRDGTALPKVLLKAGASEPSPGWLCGMGPQGEDLLKLFARDGTALLKVLLKAGASEVSAELF